MLATSTVVEFCSAALDECSGKSYMNLKVANSTDKLFADSIHLHIMLRDCSHPVDLMLSPPPFSRKSPSSRIEVPEVTG